MACVVFGSTRYERRGRYVHICYKNIAQLPPSYCITVLEGKVKLSRYGALITGQKLQLKCDEEYEEVFRDVFQNAVSARLRTNRQVGAHLSGGFDSGSVLVLRQGLAKRRKSLHTFSYVPANDFVDWTPKF